jgi:hypothetical protein
MNKRDWIILRLLMAGSGTRAALNPDYPRAILYMLKKHGAKNLSKAIDQLHTGDQP